MENPKPLERLRLPEDQARAMLDHLRAVHPEEGCGLLAVAEGDDTVVRVYPVRNIADLPRVRYEGEPLELLDAFREMERAGWRLGAIFHSHPSSPAWPSAEDLRQARYPSALALIVSLSQPATPAIGLFAIHDGWIEERPLLVTPAGGAPLDEPAAIGGRPGWEDLWERFRGKLIGGLVLGVIVLVALSLFADIRTLPQTLARFQWEWLPLILGLTLVNYGLRFVKWQYYLHLLGIDGVRTRDSLAIFLSGMTMAMTPGKVGELLKSYMLKQVAGASIAASAPIVAAERLTDGLAMIGLAAIGMIVYPLGWQALIVLVVVALAGVLVAQHRPLVHRLLGWGERLPVVSRFAHQLYRLYDSTERLLAWRPLAVAVGLGLLSWAGECVAFFLVLVGLDLAPTVTLLLQATFILAMSTLVGAVSMLPGGLGAADASVTGLLLLLIPNAPMSQPVAVAATLLIRFCTLWFGVLLGAAALLVAGRRLLTSNQQSAISYQQAVGSRHVDATHDPAATSIAPAELTTDH